MVKFLKSDLLWLLLLNILKAISMDVKEPTKGFSKGIG